MTNSEPRSVTIETSRGRVLVVESEIEGFGGILPDGGLPGPNRRLLYAEFDGKRIAFFCPVDFFALSTAEQLLRLPPEVK